MTREDIMRMAREVGAGEPESLYGRTDYVVMTAHNLARFAALVAAHEREACARIVEHYAGAWSDEGYALTQAIRARGEK
jgi:hypothetical protein